MWAGVRGRLRDAVGSPRDQAPRNERPRNGVGPKVRDRPGQKDASYAEHGDYPGDFVGVPRMVYAAAPDGEPDPGEIVWAWVPYEEDHSRGKDRPVLLIGRDGPWLLGLGLTSKDHHRDEEQERRAGRLWADLGRGPWDARGRESDVRVNRILRIDPERIRREGAVLDATRFERIADSVRAALG